MVGQFLAPAPPKDFIVMSIDVMSLVFKAEIPDLPYEKDGEKRNAKASTVKLLLLAYADHANDEGEATYPGYDRLETKTALSRQGIADTLEAVKQNGFMEFEGISKLNTKSYKINKAKLQELVKPLDSDKSSHLTTPSQATRLKPSFNHPVKPSIKEAKPPTPPEIKLFRSVTSRYPNEANFEDVILSIQNVSKRLGRDVTREDLLPFYKFWTSKGYNKYNLAWLLDWAVRGETPKNGKIAQQWATPSPAEPEPTPEYLAEVAALFKVKA